MPDISLPMPGGPLPAKEIITPYTGGVVRTTPEAQVASRAATEFTQSFHGFQGPDPNRKYNRLDAATAANLEELFAEMRRNRPSPATVVNLHPFELQFNSHYLLRGHVVPACATNQPYNYKQIRGWRHDGGSYNEDGSRKFRAIRPIDVAGEFAREFNKIETFGPGVAVYLGETHPDKVTTVELYDPMGRPVLTNGKGVDYDEEDRPLEIVTKVPVLGKFPEVLKKLRQERNAFYMTQVQKAEGWATKDNGKFSSWIQDTHRLMAEVLFHEGIIDKIPTWRLSTKLEKGLAEDNCPSCKHPVIKGAYRCEHCSNILDALAAFKDGAIEFDHAKIAMLADEQFAEAEKIQKDREKRTAKRKKKSE